MFQYNEKQHRNILVEYEFLEFPTFSLSVYTCWNLHAWLSSLEKGDWVIIRIFQAGPQWHYFYPIFSRLKSNYFPSFGHNALPFVHFHLSSIKICWLNSFKKSI